jgi:murein L,D-transpeptidase YafK
MPTRGVLASLLGLCCLAGSVVAAGAAQLVVDTAAGTLAVVAEGRSLLVLDDISIGRFGATERKRRGDGMTPLGRYRVTGVARDSRFHAFIGIDYPSIADAARARAEGLISAAEQRAIVAAHAAGRLPPQGTALGGRLGIHGLGRADPQIHAHYHWTRGCIAVTDAQLDQLVRHIEPGMPVEIR